MKYRCKVWGILARSNMLKENWLACDICQRNRDVRRRGSLGYVNRFSKLREALRMDYVGLIKGRYLLVKIDYLSKLVELDVC